MSRMLKTPRRAIATAILSLSVASIADAARLADPIPAPITDQAGVQVKLVSVADGLIAPNWGTSAPGRPDELHVVEQTGQIWAIDLRTGARRLFLDASRRLVSVGAFGPGTYDERGLLGLAFHPDYQRNGLFYTFGSEPNATVSDFPVPQGAVANTNSTVVEWHVTSPNSDGAVADPLSARVVMRWSKPQFNHNGGAIVFGRDGMLYIGTGDGGAANDRGAGHVPGGNAQNLANLLGKVLRIDVDQRTAPNGQYGVSRDNPFAPRSGPAGGQAGCVDGRCDEIYAYGFRNAFRISFDRKTGDLYAGEVGQNDVEEIDVVRRGANYGWPYKEGRFFFNVDPLTNRGFVSDTDPGVPAGLVEPLAQYDHSEGIAIVGGFVYRGKAIDGLKGRYVFGDYARAFGASNGRLMHLVRPADDDGRRGTSAIAEFKLVDRTALGLAVMGFAQDGRGEVYVLGNTTGVPSGRTGVVLKLVPANDDRQPRPRDEDDDD